MYEIVRHIMYPENNYDLSCTFPSGNRHISVVVTWLGRLPEVRRFKLNPETPEVTVLFSSQSYQ